MSKTNIEIKNQFDFFNELLENEKIIITSTIRLQEKKNNPYWLIGQSNIQHSTLQENVQFIVEKSKRDSKYGIKLSCNSLSERPFFRFDSSGPSHRNAFPEIPLEEQSISTPHFNSYRKDGKAMAYKNEILKKENEARAIVDDINFGVVLFCQETKSNLSSGEFPKVVDFAPEFKFNEEENIGLDNINFE